MMEILWNGRGRCLLSVHRLPWLLGAVQLFAGLSDGGLVHAVYDASGDADVDIEGDVDVGQEHPQAPAGCQAGALGFHHLS